MPNIFWTQDPTKYRELDGVIVTEKAPPLLLRGVSSSNAVFLGQFQKGPERAQRVSGSGELEKIFGEAGTYSGPASLKGKPWANLFVVRVTASNAAKAAYSVEDAANVTVLTVTAKAAGVYGNTIKLTIGDGTTANTKKLTVSQGETTETYDNLAVAGKTDEELAAIFGNSELIVVTGAHATKALADVAETNLSGGTDGTVAATDYTAALAKVPANLSGKIYFADDQSAAVKTALSNHVKSENDGVCVLAPEDLDVTVADAVTDAKTFQDNFGRVLYAFNPVGYLDPAGVLKFESPAPVLASILNLSPPHVSPSAARNSQWTTLAVDVQNQLSRGNLITLKEAGIMAFENDPDLGIRVVSPVTGSPNISVLRRRMTDFYIASVSLFLKNFQGEPNNLFNRQAIRSAILSFDDGLIQDGILPSDAELEDGGKARSIKTEGVTSDSEKAQGIMKIEIKRRLFPAARFIVLIAEIGESVIVQEG